MLALVLSLLSAPVTPVIQGPRTADSRAMNNALWVTARAGHSYVWTLDRTDCPYDMLAKGVGCLDKCLAGSQTALSNTQTKGCSTTGRKTLYFFAPESGAINVSVVEVDSTGAQSAPATATVAILGGRQRAAWRDGLAQIVEPDGWQRTAPATRAWYPSRSLHSPISPAVAAHLRNIVSHADPALQDNRLIKVGDSITASDAFFGWQGGTVKPAGGTVTACLDLGNATTAAEYPLQLTGAEDFLEAVYHYRSGTIVTATNVTSSFGRRSLAAAVSRDAKWAVSGSPSPLLKEIAAASPGAAVVMFGTNDIGTGGTATYPIDQKLQYFVPNLIKLVDTLLVRGIVPVLSTIPPRLDEGGRYQRIVPIWNAAVRAVAYGRQVPLVDYYRQLVTSPDLAPPASATAIQGWGIDDDGMHPTYVSEWPYQLCNWTRGTPGEGMHTGYLNRSYVTLQGLERLRQVVIEGSSGPDAHTALPGAGTAEDPYLIDPADTTPVFGAEVMTFGDLQAAGVRHYRITLQAPLRLRLVTAGAAAALTLRDGSGAVVGAHGRLLARSLAAGDYRLTVDAAGEHVVAAAECNPEDGCN